MTEAIATQPRRADAQRNYERIIATARIAISERGADVVLEDIARSAGVGIGTLYRHFPTRQALFEATFLDEARELRTRAEALCGADALCGAESAFDALIGWLRLQMDFGAHGHAMGAAVMNAKHTEGSPIQSACVAMRSAGAALLERAQKAGEVRPGVQLADVLRLIHGVVVANEQATDPERNERLFELIVAGIRA